MIEEAVKRWDLTKDKVLATFKENSPENYKAVVRTVIENITSEDDYDEFNPDPDRIHEIDDGAYQGTLVFVIGAKGYQPHNYWYVRVWYGSCSGCDTLEAIRGYSCEAVSDDQAKNYQTLALHIVQGLKVMEGDGV